MKNPIDAIGNELYPGDMVAVDLNDIKWKIGKVINVQPGGLSMPGRGNMQTSGRLQIIIEMNIDVPHGQLVARVLKVINPQATATISKIMKN